MANSEKSKATSTLGTQSGFGQAKFCWHASETRFRRRIFRLVRNINTSDTIRKSESSLTASKLIKLVALGLKQALAAATVGTIRTAAIGSDLDRLHIVGALGFFRIAKAGCRAIENLVV